MRQWLQQKFEVLPAGLRAARQIDDEALLPDARCLSAENRIRRILQTVGPKCLPDARNLAITYRLRRLRCQISQTEAGASGREDDTDLSLIRETRELQIGRASCRERV